MCNNVWIYSSAEHPEMYCVKCHTLAPFHSLTFGSDVENNTTRPALWSSGQSLWLLIMRSRVQFPAGLGRLVEFRFKGPPGTTSSSITTHIIGDNVTAPHGRPTLRSRLHSCHAQERGSRSPQGHLVAMDKKKTICDEVTFARQRKAITATVKKCIICISDARSATKTNPGPRTYAAVNVQQIFHSGWMAKDMRCRLLFLWFGGSQVITQLTATAVWCHLFLEAKKYQQIQPY